jgi:uncharacterized protein (TIGR00297 family)
MNNLAEIAWLAPAAWPAKLWISTLISLIFAAFGRAVRGVTTSGAVAGGAVCFALMVAAGLTGFAALLTVFALTWLATRFGYAHKQSLGTAERGSGRTVAQVLANLGVPAICALLYILVRQDFRLRIALIAALAEAAADTVSSEIGQAVGGLPRLVTNWNSVSAGTDGAITFAGTAAGVATAIVVSLVGRVGWRSTAICATAGVIGMMADSFLGATVEHRGILGNNAVNFSSTAIAALTAFIIALLV